MTDYFIDSNATGANNGTSWADAWNAGTQADWTNAASTATTAGDRVAVANNNATSLTANLSMSVNANHTKDNPLKIIVSSSTSGTTITPVSDYGAAGNGEIDGNGAYDIGFSGNVYVYGLRIQNMDSSSADAGGNSPVFERCYYNMNKTGSAETFTFGNGGELTFIDSDINIASQAHDFGFNNDYGKFRMIGGAITTDANATEIFNITSTKSCIIELVGVDLTGVNAATDMVGGGSPEGVTFDASGCNWPATLPALWGGTTANLGDLDKFTASGSQIESSCHYKYGTVLNETTIRRANGATDGATDYSLKIESTSTASRTSPFRHFLAVVNPGDLDTLTIKVHFAQNSGAALDDEEIWIETMAATSSGMSYNTDRLGLGGTATNHTDESGGVDWRNGASALTSYNEQSCSVTVSGTTAGVLYVYLCVAADFTTTNNLYVDPKPVIA